MNNREILVYNLKLLRVAHELRQQELSFALGFRTNRINQIETQPRIKVTEEEVDMIAHYFKVDPILLTTVRMSVVFNTV